MQQAQSSGFRRMLKEASKGDKVVPVLRAALYDPDFKDFWIKVEGYKERKPDGWFHPSEHPLVPERQLFYYLTEPERLVPEPYDPTKTLAVTAGSFFHSFSQTVLADKGLLIRQPEVCECGAKHDAPNVEVYAINRESQSRGHSDGALSFGDGFEFKTGHPSIVGKIKDLESFKERKPGYYAQTQDYMRMLEWEAMRVVFMALVFPFDMSEIIVPFDRQFATGVRDKYMRVLQAAADQRITDPCCNPGSADSKICFARAVCPVGRMS